MFSLKIVLYNEGMNSAARLSVNQWRKKSTYLVPGSVLSFVRLLFGGGEGGGQKCYGGGVPSAPYWSLPSFFNILSNVEDLNTMTKI